MQAGYPEVVSSEIAKSGSRRCQDNRKATRRRAITRVRRGPAESKTPRMHRNFTRENREAPWPSAVSRTADRWEKAMSYKSHMHGGGESYSGIVPAKQPNEGEGGPAGGCGGKAADQGEHGSSLTRAGHRAGRAGQAGWTVCGKQQRRIGS